MEAGKRHMTRRVVVTGMGCVTPLGLGVKETWASCVNGISGVGRITLFDTTDWPVLIGAEVKDFNPANYMDAKEARRRDRFEQLAIAAAKEALESSGLVVTEQNAGRISAMIGTGVGGSKALQDGAEMVRLHGPRKISPFMIPMTMVNGAAGMTAIDFGLRGPAFSVSSACATGADSLGVAAMFIRAGRIDAALAGGTEASMVSAGLAGFDRVGALSHQNDDWSMTPAPFDKNRDGLVAGEGAAVLMLEELEHAKARGANIIAELAGYGSSNDAFHITAPQEQGAGAAAAIAQALDEAQVNVDAIDYINAHGTATQLNDSTETKAVKLALGEHAYNTPMSSTKSMTGHMIAATGALEAIFSALAIRDGVMPPTIHYQTPDPACDLDYIPNTAREKTLNTVMSNAFGFGGHNAVLVVKRFVN
jgi:3-oxoacyl-[acyl-carrier-protein] synthase II